MNRTIATIKTIAAASIMGLTITGAGLVVDATPAHALPISVRHTTRKSCEAAGYLWDSRKGCADKTCEFGGRRAEPGSVIILASGSVLVCNGFTGRWTRAIESNAPTLSIEPTFTIEDVEQFIPAAAGTVQTR